MYCLLMIRLITTDNVSLLCHLPTPPAPPPSPPTESKTELSSLISWSVIVCLYRVAIAFWACFCFWSLFQPFTLSNLFCPELYSLPFSFLCSSFSYHLVAYFGTSGLFVFWVANYSIPFRWMAWFTHQKIAAERFLLNLLLHGSCAATAVCHWKITPTQACTYVCAHVHTHTLFSWKMHKS